MDTTSDYAAGLRRKDFRDALRAEVGLLAPGAATLPWAIRAALGGSLLGAVQRNAARDPEGLAFERYGGQATWASFAEACARRAYVLRDRNVSKGDVVALLGPNAIEYLAWIFACTHVGATAALINTNLSGSALLHAQQSAKASLLVVHERFATRGSELPTLVYGTPERDDELKRAPSAPFPSVPIRDEIDFVYIYTSGTTGLPKPCRISHGRAMMAAAGFGKIMFGFEDGDKLYNVLPLYHASGLLLGVGSCIVTRTPMALREAFSARAFWPDVRRYQATAILYIGELCRYLANAPSDIDTSNNVRIAVGNGLRPDVWPRFQQRFAIPTIREFYGATEAPGFIFNLTGRPGSVGRVPLRRAGWLVLVRYDIDRDEHLRDAEGRLVECRAGEVGELLVRIAGEGSKADGFRGYTDAKATRAKTLENVFVDGDRYFRSGDLLRFDEDDYFYFVDRIGDTFRWKGENVSTAEVQDVLSAAPFVDELAVVGVALPGHDGRAGFAALALREGATFDVAAFEALAARLPSYAQPRLVRVVSELRKTGTYKFQKSALREGALSLEGGPLFRWDAGRYHPVDATDLERLAQGELRL